MNLVVGHNCPGCGLDTPAVACGACGGGVVWNRESGSHCSACGVSASTFTCPECDLHTELDKHEPERVARVPLPSAREPDEHDEAVRSFAWLPLAGKTMAGSPTLRAVAVVALVGVPALAITALIGSRDGSPQRPAVRVAAAPAATAPVPERLNRGAVQLSLDAKPVPLPPRNPDFDPPPLSPPSFAEPQPTVVTRADTGYRAAPRREGGWFQRVLRSGRSYSPANDRIPADGAGIGR